MKLLTSFYGELGYTYYGIPGISVSVRRHGEKELRPTLPAEKFKFHEDTSATDIIELVAFGRIAVELPDVFRVRIGRGAVSLRNEKGVLETYTPGTVVEVEGTDPRIGPMIATQQLIPLSLEVWAPTRLNPGDRIHEAAQQKNRKG